MKHGLGLIASSFAVAGMWLLACSSQPGVSGGGTAGPGTIGTIGGNQGDTGSVGMHLAIANGIVLQEISWTIAGPGLPSYSGMVPIGDAQGIEFVVGGLQAGGPYTATLSGTDSNGDPCAGSGTFSITAGATSSATVAITCTEPPDASSLADVVTGNVAVTGGVTVVSAPAYHCPGISSFSVNPAELLAPETSALQVATTVAPGGSPGTETIEWTTTAGTFVDTGSQTSTLAAPAFSCGAFIGTAVVTVTIGLTGSNNGVDAGDVCASASDQTISANIVCEPQCVTAANCAPTGTLCATPVCSAGLCGVTDATVGTFCNDNGGEICNGGGTCVLPTFDVVRIGNGSVPLASTTAPAFIDQYDLGGNLVTSTPLPTAASGTNQALTLAGTDATVGDLTTSADGRFLVMAGYNYPVGSTITSGSCVAALISGAPTLTVNTSTLLPSAFPAGGVIRSAASVNGSEVWVAGTATGTGGGLWYSPGDVQIVQTTTTKQARFVRIANGQLYGDSNADPPGLFTIGSGTPTSGSPAPTLTELPGLPTSGAASPYGFVFVTVNGVQTLYIADDRTSAGGGIGKWTLSGGTWTNVWAVAGVAPAATDAGTGDAGTGVTGYRGLAGYATGSQVTLMATTGMGSGAQDSLVVIVDTGIGNPSQTVVATSSSAETFRGVALPPHN